MIFRGMPIPIDTYQKGCEAIAFQTMVSAQSSQAGRSCARPVRGKPAPGSHCGLAPSCWA